MNKKNFENEKIFGEKKLSTQKRNSPKLAPRD